MKKVTVLQLPQQGVKDLELRFPDGWDVSVFDMAGYDKAPLGAGDFRSALQKPLGAPTIREIAKGKSPGSPSGRHSKSPPTCAGDLASDTNPT
jgi:hypothetical protein